jgi:biotin-(acetyl-CoA carboxylase) ligase
MVGNKNEVIKWLLEQQDNKYEVKLYKDKRSLDANAYYHKLLNEIANILKLNKEQLHFKFLKEYGQVASCLLPAEVEINGFTKYNELTRTIDIKGKLFNEYRLFKGSSEMNSAEMSILIQGIENEAKELGIQTLDELRVKEMLESWGR